VTYVPNPAAEQKLRLAVVEGVNAFMLIISRTMRVELSKQGGGFPTKVRKGKKNARNLREAGFHRASRAGQPPAADTGLLRGSWMIGRNQLLGPTGDVQPLVGGFIRKKKRSIHITATQAVVVKIDRPNLYGYRYGSRLPYARIDRGYGNVKARPYIRPTLNNVRDLFQPTMQRALQRATRGA
jgi:hypothetical protein